MTFEDLEREFKEFLIEEYDSTTHNNNDFEGALNKQILFLSNKIIELNNKIEEIKRQ